ncbi:MAG TPA: hypothetical protein VFC63_11090 [Blastocatellia bacterium]|nr:hypothetical protein [Blastocatellia bacterium]
MNAKETPVSLRILIWDDNATAASELEGDIVALKYQACSLNVEYTVCPGSIAESWSLIRDKQINLILIDPLTPNGDPNDDAIKFIEDVRIKYPKQIVFILHQESGRAKSALGKYKSKHLPLDTFYSLDKELSSKEFSDELVAVLNKAANYLRHNKGLVEEPTMSPIKSLSGTFGRIVASPLNILKLAIDAVPAVRYALGIAGIAAAAAIIKTLIKSPEQAVFGVVIMLVLMVVLVVFANLAQSGSASTGSIGKVLAWFFVILIMSTSLLIFTGYFFNWPRPIGAQVVPGTIPTAPVPNSANSNKDYIKNLDDIGGTGWILLGMFKNCSTKQFAERYFDPEEISSADMTDLQYGDRIKIKDDRKVIIVNWEETKRLNMDKAPWQIREDSPRAADYTGVTIPAGAVIKVNKATISDCYVQPGDVRYFWVQISKVPDHPKP